MIKDNKTRQPSEGYNEAVGSLQTELATKEEEVESLKVCHSIILIFSFPEIPFQVT